MSTIFISRDCPMAFLVFSHVENTNKKIILTAPITADQKTFMAPFLAIFQTLRQNYPRQHFHMEGSGTIIMEHLAYTIHVFKPYPRYGPASERVVRELLHEAMIKESLVHYQLEITDMKP